MNDEKKWHDAKLLKHDFMCKCMDDKNLINNEDIEHYYNIKSIWDEFLFECTNV